MLSRQSPDRTLTSPSLQAAASRIFDGLQRRSAILLQPRHGFRDIPPHGMPASLGRIGPLEVRLARTRHEVKQAQQLRYQVFYEEMSAVPDLVSRLKRRDIDPYDPVCDHLLVIDHAAPPRHRIGRKGLRLVPAIVGTYRLLRQERAEAAGGFYSAGEFDIEPMLRAHPGRTFLELGRSCVLSPYRDKRTIELLWHGIWTYVLHHGIDVMFGCASIEGTDALRHAPALGFLHHHARAPVPWRVSALPGRAVAMDTLPAATIDPRRALHELPPLIKGYLRVGARIGDGAVVDYRFGTTDVLVVLPVELINKRYIGHFGADASRHAA
jgi:putative hemolysin